MIARKTTAPPGLLQSVVRDPDKTPSLLTGKPIPPVPGGLLKEGSDPLKEGVNDAPEVYGKPAEVATGQARYRLSSRNDAMYLNLGPAYEGIKLPYDLLEQYRYDIQVDVPVETVELGRPVLEGLKQWSYLVQAVPSIVEADLVRWLLVQAFVDRQARTWWRLARETVRVPDPTCRGVVTPRDYIQLHVFLPYGNRGAYELVAGSVRFNPTLRPPTGTSPVDQYWNPTV